jgi:uncharacterized protein YggT (Ycf19 family)
MTPGRVGYLLYEMRTEWPSQPDSIEALLSPVPSRLSMRLRRRRSPQLRMAQLAWLATAFCLTLGVSRGLHFGFQAGCC